MDLHPAPATDTETRPCAHCGRPVPQRAAAGRPFRYCRDNDGECQRASRNVRMRHRASPGLAGQVSRTWEVVERLDQMVGTLTESLHQEMSPAGVERQVAEVRAETAHQVAAAHAERDEARREAELATTAAMAAEQATAVARAERDAARRAADIAAAAAEVAAAEATRAIGQRDDAHRRASAAAALQAQAETDRDDARRDVGILRRERDEAARRLAETTQDRDAARADAERATRSAAAAVQQAEQFRAEAAAAQAGARAAAAETDTARRAAEQATAATATARAELAGTREQLTTVRAELARATEQAASAERDTAAATRLGEQLQRSLDTARADADAAHHRVAQLTAQVSDLASALAALGTARPAAPGTDAAPVIPSAR